MRWSVDRLIRRRREQPDPPGAEERLGHALRESHPAVEAPDGLAERIERAALRSSAHRLPARRRVLVPAAAVTVVLAIAAAWHTPTLRAHHLAAGMRTAWETVRDYHAEGRCSLALLGRKGEFRICVWYARPDSVRADVTASSAGLDTTFVVTGRRARIQVPAMATEWQVPLEGDFALLRDLTQVGHALRRLEEMRELRMVGSDAVAGQECYVLRYRTRSLLERARRRLGLGVDPREVGEIASSGKVWVSKATLLPMKLEAYDPDGLTVVAAEFRSVAVNDGVDPKVFRVPPLKKVERLGTYTWQELLREIEAEAEDMLREMLRG